MTTQTAGPPEPPHEPPPGEQQSLTAATVHGLKWSYTSTMTNMVLQIGVTAVLARLLTPSAFGLVAMAGVFLRFGQYFAQMGAGQAIVQRPELSRKDVHTAFTSSLLIGAVFCGLFAALAPLAGVLFPGTPDVVAVTRVMSLTFLVAGLTATTQGLLRRHFAFRAIALVEISTFMLGYALVGLVLAFSGLGVWSLVAASLSQGALAAMAYIVLCRKEIGLGLSASSFRTIYSFGARVSLIGFGEFIASNLDTLWAGHFLGATATGLYSRARNLASLPLYYLSSGLSRVLLPAYSRIQNERVRVRSTYLATIAVVNSLAMPISWGAAASSHEVVATLLGRQWLDAAPAMSLLAVAVPFTLLTHFGAIICEATATLTAKIVITAARIVWLAVLLVGLGRYGILGVAGALAVSELITYLAYQVTMRRLLSLGARELLSALAPGMVVGLLTAALLFMAHAGLAQLGWPAPAVLSAQLLLGATVLLVAVTRIKGGYVWRQLRSRLIAAGYGHSPGAVTWLMGRIDSIAGT